MVTIVTIPGMAKHNGKESGAIRHECYGLSSDDKPLTVLNSSTFYEIDTKSTKMFDAENKVWYDA